MSTAQTIQEQETRSIFNHRIYENENICDNCYTKTHDLLRNYDPANLPKSLRGVLNSHVDRVEAETVYYQSYSVSEGIATICSQCKSEGQWNWRVKQLQKSQRVRAIRNLYKRLQEEGDIQVEYSDLYEATKDRALDPTNQRKPVTEIFRKAVDEVSEIQSKPEIEEAITPQEGKVIVDFHNGGTKLFDASQTTISESGVRVEHGTVAFRYEADTIKRVVEPPQDD